MYLPYNNIRILLTYLELNTRLRENFIRPFVIACHRLVDIDLHDCTKGVITLICHLIQTYFKDICIPYRTAIFKAIIQRN